MGKGLHKLLNATINDILQDLPTLGEYGSEVSYFIPEPINFAEVTRLSEYIKKPWLKATLKEIKSWINNNTFLVQDPEKGEPVTPCMDVYKAKIQYDGSLYKLKLRIVVRGYLQNKELVGDTFSPTASTRILKNFLECAAKNKARLYHLDFIGAFLQAKINNRVFVKLDSIYADYFPEYSSYLGRAVVLLKSIYGMTNSVIFFWWVDRVAAWNRLY